MSNTTHLFPEGSVETLRRVISLALVDTQHDDAVRVLRAVAKAIPVANAEHRALAELRRLGRALALSAIPRHADHPNVLSADGRCARCDAEHAARVAFEAALAAEGV